VGKTTEGRQPGRRYKRHRWEPKKLNFKTVERRQYPRLEAEYKITQEAGAGEWSKARRAGYVKTTPHQLKGEIVIYLFLICFAVALLLTLWAAVLAWSEDEMK